MNERYRVPLLSINIDFPNVIGKVRTFVHCNRNFDDTKQSPYLLHVVFHMADVESHAFTAFCFRLLNEQNCAHSVRIE